MTIPVNVLECLVTNFVRGLLLRLLVARDSRFSNRAS
jgi:hypothetical protein